MAAAKSLQPGAAGGQAARHTAVGGTGKAVLRGAMRSSCRRRPAAVGGAATQPGETQVRTAAGTHLSELAPLLMSVGRPAASPT